ncbi:MAG: 1-acyl-sn-glycerol-3-phosphate acyltransferase [Bacteroidota bacterium]
MHQTKVRIFEPAMQNPYEIPEHLIDIERVIASKNPALSTMIPGFVIRYLKRIVHQDAVNGYIYRNRDKVGLEFVDAILAEFGAEIIADLVSRILKPDGRYILASNHPLGGLDGMALIQVVGRVRQDLVFPVNDILMNVPGMQPLFIPINKHGKNTENVRIIDETFASDKVILYFPAGLVSRKQKGGVIRDLEWKKTFITKAKRYHRDVIPVYISGQNSNFFYNLANWRKRLGIKANLEMLFLVDEMVKQKDKPIRITFGEPIPWSTFDKTRSDSQWAESVKEVVYSLAAEN